MLAGAGGAVSAPLGGCARSWLIVGACRVIRRTYACIEDIEENRDPAWTPRRALPDAQAAAATDKPLHRV